MNWIDLEKTFLSACKGIFCRTKWVMAFASLSLSGFFFIFCKALSLNANSFLKLSLLFFPPLVSTIFFLLFGVFLLQREVSFVKLTHYFAPLALKITPFALAPLLAYGCLWLSLGLFFLVKEIPYIGPLFNIIFAFAPFLLIVSSILLCLFSFFLLFFITPFLTQGNVEGIERRIWASLKANPFLSGALFLIAILPALLIGALLSLAAILTDVSFSLEGPSFAIALEWFFVMLPFAALLSPAVVFFFQFAQESHQLLRRK